MLYAKLVGEMNVTGLCTVLDLQKGNTDNCIQVLTKTKGELFSCNYGFRIQYLILHVLE